MQVPTTIRTVPVRGLAAGFALAAAILVGGYALRAAAPLSIAPATVAPPSSIRSTSAPINTTNSLSDYPYVVESQPNGDTLRSTEPATGFPYVIESQPEGDHR